MNVLLLGGGGREHAFAWKLAQSPKLTRLFIAPGNAGTSSSGTNVDLAFVDMDAVIHFVEHNEIDLVIVGPEAPLVLGLTDALNNYDPNLPVIGPQSSGAQLEGSKDFSKKFMLRHGIPTARYRSFTSSEKGDGIEYLKRQSPPIVLKADGLAAGKGVLICESISEAITELESMLGGKFGEASSTVVVEEFLDGIEFSVFVLTDGKDYRILPVAKDYKRIGEGDRGLNTGGMGSISPVPFVTQSLMSKVEDQIIGPTIKGIQSEGLVYKGFIFFGLIKVGDQPFVIEYNCRMGDPETQSVLPRLSNDLIDLCMATHHGTLAQENIVIDKRVTATTVMVSGGYPGRYEKGKPIGGLDNLPDGLVFHAGTIAEGSKILTNGGRVLGLTGLGKTIEEARDNSKKLAERISFEGHYFRRDIGFDLV